MAQQTVVSLIDDLDGSQATQTIEFSYKSKPYKLDLNDTNAAELEEALAPYIAAAQKGAADGSTTRARSGRRQRAATSGQSGSDYDPKGSPGLGAGEQRRSLIAGSRQRQGRGAVPRRQRLTRRRSTAAGAVLPRHCPRDGMGR